MVESIHGCVCLGHLLAGVLAAGVPDALHDGVKHRTRARTEITSAVDQGKLHGLRNVVESTQSQIWFSDSLARDLTGDGLVDTVVVLATGSHPDSLEITLTVWANGILYRDTWTSRDYRGSEGYSDPDRSIRQQLHDNHFGRLDPRYHSAELERSAPLLIAEQIGGTINNAQQIYREMLDRGMPFFAYQRGAVSYRLAWSPSQRCFLVLVRAG